MSQPVAPGTDQSLVNLPSGIPAEIRISRADSPLRSLTPGSIVEVRVQRGGPQGSGVVINGEFVKAALPDEIPDGAKLLVRVVPTADAVILRISSAAQLRGEQLITQSFEAILRSLLPDLRVEDLRRGLPSAQPLGIDLAKILLSLENKATPAQSVELNSPIARIFQSLLKNNALIGETLLKNPTSLQSALTSLSKGEHLAEVQKALQSVSTTGASAAPASVVRFLKALDTHIELLLTSPKAFESGSEPIDAKALANQLKLYLLVSQNAVESGSSKALQAIAKETQLLRRGMDPISFMLGLFQNLELPEFSDRASGQLASQTMRGMAQDLQKLKENNLPPAAVRDGVRLIHEKAKTLLRQLETSNKDIELAPQAQQVLKGIESIMHAQASLMQVNPVMHALGEPSLVLLPALVQGIFGAWRVSVKESIENEKEGGQSKGAAKQFVRIGLSLTLPSLGPIEVDVAHRKGEVLVHIASTNTDVTTLISERAPQLEEAFKQLGYDKTAFSASTGKLKSSVPGWFHELSHQSIVA